ncbi:hypothetical protein Cni_G22923 [Canna indica]|uniref:Avr9/Cf-9 rapidly elicited protein 146 n=1 Tax=Canna indica TaxID=4628 RepID=A0AAQ3QLQ7_9LILI|nr:hypothetical protein Cni_G22923 [Canna indica]
MVQMESSRSAGKRLWRIVRVVFYMLGKSLSMSKLMMDLHLLLKRGKTARKALGHFMTFNPHHLHGGATATYSGFSCRSMDPNSFYSPREVQFSCSSTPSHPSFHAIKRSRRHRREDCYDAAAVAEAFEILMMNSEITESEPVMASPSPAPVVARQLRITDSPSPLWEEEEEEDGHIDEEAEEFINRFYEQLRLQQRFPVTPEYRRHEQLMGRA